MSFSISCDMSCKLKQSDVNGYLNEVFRDVNESNNQHIKQKKSIDKTRTQDNMTYLLERDENNILKYKKASHKDDLKNKLKNRLDTVTKTIRKDAVVMRSLCVQFADELSINDDKAKIQKYFNDVLEWLISEFSEENIMGFSIHLDEKTPHCHFMITPVKDNSLSQKHFFNGRNSYTRIHKSLRTYLKNEKGYDIKQHSVASNNAVKRVTEKEFQDITEMRTVIAKQTSHIRDLQKQLEINVFEDEKIYNNDEFDVIASCYNEFKNSEEVINSLNSVNNLINNKSSDKNSNKKDEQEQEKGI